MKPQNYMLIALLFLFSCKKDPAVNPEPANPEPNVPTKSSEKKITSFKFVVTTPETIGVIDEATKKITVVFPYGTNIKALQPAIKVSEKATVNNNAFADFSQVVTYTVTAEDGTNQNYQVFSSIGAPKFNIDTYNGPTELEAGNSTFSIKGSGFGTNPSKVQVILTNNTSAAKTTISSFTVLNDATISLAIPENLAVGQYKVEVIVDGQAVNMPVTLNIVYATPIIESLNSASLDQSETLTINGRFFTTGNTLSITFTAKTSGTVYTINYPNSHVTSATSNKITVMLASIPGGTYAVKVHSNNKTSAAKDLEVIAPVVFKPTIIKVNRSSNTDGESFRLNDTMVIVVKYVSMSPNPNIKFVSLDGPGISNRTGVITYQGMEGSDLKYQVDSTLPKGSYRIIVEQNGKSSDESSQIIKII